jgi:hypothetical protein
LDSSWIAIYLPIFVVLFIVIPQQLEIQKATFLKMKKGRGVITMTNEVIKKYIEMNCKISTGSYGTSVSGKILDVNENWIEVQTKRGKELINADFVQTIKVK